MGRKVLIAAGGTGGHIYPGIALASSLMKLNSDIEIEFVGKKGGLETEIIPKAGFKLHEVKIKGFSRMGIWGKLISLFRLPFAFVQSHRILKEIKPSFVFGVGGYVTGPILLLARLKKIPTAIWEPNAYPGYTNQILSRFIDECHIVFADASKHLHSKKIIKSGLPVRSNLKPKIREKKDRLRIFVFGGSQGARALNKIVSRSVVKGGPWLEIVEIKHQTGPNDFEAVNERYKDHEHIEAYSYVEDMQSMYNWADLVVCRAGASTIGELSACKKASILVPLPHAAGDHQLKNAQALAKNKAAVLIKQEDFTIERFISLAYEYTRNPDRLRLLEQNIATFDTPGAADKIAKSVLERIHA